MTIMAPDDIRDLVKSRCHYLAHNYQLIDIFEGNLQGYIDDELKKQLSLQTYQQAAHRLSPVNILPKVIDKLTNIYQTSVTRTVSDGTDADQELLDWYADAMCANTMLNISNEFFNLCKASLLYPYVENGTPRLRVIPNDRFVVYSDNALSPHLPTQVTLLAGKVDGKDVYWTWTANEFSITDEDGETLREQMLKYNNYDGLNPIGRLPFVYVNESKNKLLPTLDTDTLKMVKVLPVMLTDLNVAAMFQSFAILYATDAQLGDIKFAPNVVWDIKSDPTSDKKPEIGTIKPQVDYDQVLGLIQAQLSMWLATKGIRSSSVGQLAPDNFASGISKIIDEMDTYEARQKQVSVYEDAEDELWDLTLNYMHPYWKQTGLIDNAATFTPTAEVVTKFAVQLPMQSRGVAVNDLAAEYKNGFISRRRAIAKLNPEYTDAEIDALIAEIDAEKPYVSTSNASPNQSPGQPYQSATPGVSGSDS